MQEYEVFEMTDDETPFYVMNGEVVAKFAEEKHALAFCGMINVCVWLSQKPN